MCKPFIEGCLQRVVRRVGDRILGKDAAKHGNAVTRAAIAGQWIALRGRVAAKPYQSNSTGGHAAYRGSSGNHRGPTAICAIGKVQPTGWSLNVLECSTRIVGLSRN